MHFEGQLRIASQIAVLRVVCLRECCGGTPQSMHRRELRRQQLSGLRLAGRLRDCIQRGKFVQLSERRDVKAGFIEYFGRGPREHSHHSYMHKLGCLLTQDVYTEKLHVLAAEE
jgi:hypothetical protein